MENETEEKKWHPIDRVKRRLLGVLVEKAKTTPASYPMTVNAVMTASNQKSNRSPQMQLAADDVDLELDNLRQLGAVVEVQGDGRKSKFKHRLYEWLGVDKIELAVMAELLLRGQQTLGDLRSRASRMEKIEGQAELKPIVQGLIAKGLIIELTPPGRGQIVTHGLYQPEELPKLERQIVASGTSDTTAKSETGNAPRSQTSDSGQTIEELKKSVELLTERVARLEEKLQT